MGMQDVRTEYEASPREHVRRQVEEYEASQGERNNTMKGLPVVIVTMRGARSGKLRKVPLMRVEHGGTYVAVASQGGAPEHPQWYHNLVAHPEVKVQDRAQVVTARARLATGQERAQWWERCVAAFPNYADYQERTEREIPVFLLEPAAE
jgi:F420H(2)-dependent quinone reductase